MQKIKHRGQSLVLHPFKGVYWEEEDTLLVADLHLGKASHFRKAGIPVPQEVQQTNYEKLTALLLDLRPSKVLILGDLFHSEHNQSWEDFISTTRQFNETSFELVIGNHDIMDLEKYKAAKLKMHEEGLVIGSFMFTHHPLEEIPEGLFNFCGHVHPAVRLQGRGRQGLSLPCFYFGKDQAILPAFGAFTGTYSVKTEQNDRVFVVAEEEVIGVT